MPKTVDHDAYRKELLRKCFDLFGRRGFSNVTMRQIGREIGVSTGTLYHYFPTKLDVLEQLFSWAVEEDIEAYSESADRDLPLSEKVARISQFWMSSGNFYENLLLLALDLFRNSTAEGEEVFGNFADHYKAAISKSLGTNPQLSEVIFTYLLGFVVHSLLTPGRFSFGEQALVLPDVLRALIAGCNSDAAKPVAPRQRRLRGEPGNSPAARGEVDA
jgi:AcrR family transcriptional regulator